MSEHTNALSRRAFIGAAAAGTAAMALPNTAFGVTSAEKQAEADAVRNQLVGLMSDLETASDNYYAALDEQQTAQDAMDAEQQKIDETNAQIAGLQDKLSTRARSMYRTGSSSFLDFILGATSFEEFTQNWDLLTQMNKSDSDMVDSSKTLREQLEASKAEYAKQEQIAADKAKEAAQIQQEIQAKVDQAQALVNSLDAEAQQLLEQEQAAAAAAKAAEEEAARKAAEEAAAAAAAANNNSGSGSGSSSGTSSNSGSNSGSSTNAGNNSGSSTNTNTNSGTTTKKTTTTDTSTSTNSSGGTSYSSVVDYALSRIGCPYVWGAEGPNSFDCSGLVKWSYAQIGISLPHQSQSLYNVATWRGSVSQARPGDVLWRSGHVGIAVSAGGSHYVHAPTFGAYVRDTDSLSWAGFTHSLRFG